ncbi:DUF4166 domain-containing protein [Pseudalkalibacillus sp. Hm43]|uniref:DUF4166 domain-containing protein n=1 Tax=Pseudalkalibacillus sp. Hm43 TaxID=3450742 RepID=UPI003F41E56E
MYDTDTGYEESISIKERGQVEMPSFYENALGSDFNKLHPKIQEKFNISTEDQEAIFCKGVMEEISGPSWVVKPVKKFGTDRHLIFPERGRDIPFDLEIYAFKDPIDRETLSWIRTFHFDKVDRRFDSTMVYSNRFNEIMDYLGNVQATPVGIDLKVTESGGLILSTSKQYFYVGNKRLSVPSGLMVKGIVHEEYDDTADHYKVDITVNNAVLGTVFRYRGTFEMEKVPFRSPDIPQYAYPKKYDAKG